MTTHAGDEITAFFAADPGAIGWPYPMYARWRAGTGVVRWDDGPATLVTHHRDVKDVMGGAFPVRQDGYRYGELAEGTIARLPLEMHETFFEVLDFESHFMSRKDGDDHRRLRRVAARAFTPRRIEQLRVSIQRHIDALIVEMSRRPDPDLKRDLADKLPVRVIVDLIGVPQEDRDMIWNWSEAIARLFSLDADSLEAAARALDDFRAYIGATIARVRATGEGPELARLMLGSRNDEAMTEDELVAMYLLLLFGGTETTTNLLGNGFLALQRNRDQWQTLVREPELIRGAIDELLRFDTPHHYLPRVALEDFELRGTRIRRNETIIVLMGAANRDPDVFDDPDRLDVARPNKGDHLSFAFGAHHCLGAALARLEGEIVFTTLVERFPDATLATDAITYRGSAMLRAIDSLPTDLGVG